MAIGEAHGKSSTFTVSKVATYLDRLCGPPMVEPVGSLYVYFPKVGYLTKQSIGENSCKFSSAAPGVPNSG